MEKYRYSYNGNGKLYSVEDVDNDINVCYNYDSLNRLVSTWQTDGYDTAYTYYTYDAKGRVAEYNCKMNTSGISFAQNYAYNYDSTDNLLNSMTVNNDTISYTYDDVERLTNKTVTSTGINLQQIYSYNDGEYMTQQISGMTVKVGNTNVKNFSYTYDNLGNIKTVSNNGVLLYEYEYDEQGQLITEIFYEDDFALDYVYDAYGNILGFEEYSADKETSYGKVYIYEYEDSQWKDRLTSYDGVEFTYDSIGNPLEYYNGYEIYNFSWQNGRELASADFGHSTVTYKYGADGLRVQKTVDGTTHDYYYSNGLLVREVITYSSSYIEILDFLYDESGLPYSFVQSFNYNGTTGSTQFYYVKNLQCDVVAITDANGNIVAEYTYDAWGCVLYTNEYTHDNIGYVNPIRYRSYYQDNETGFYYLQSRYYDPLIKRFLNADTLIDFNSMIGLNLYSYCFNNPVNKVDYTGENTDVLSTYDWLIGILISLADGPLPFGEIVTILIFVGVVGDIISNSDISFDEDSDEEISLPDASDVGIDIDHIMDQHHPSSGKSPKKDKFDDIMTAATIEEMVRNAYQNAVDNLPDSIIKIQGGVRYFLQGFDANQKIYIWYDSIKKIIVTAFPKP